MTKRFRNMFLIAALAAFSTNVFAAGTADAPAANTAEVQNQNIEDNTAEETNETQGGTAEVPKTGQGKQVILTLDNPAALVDGAQYALNVPPKVVGGSTYLPLKFVATQILGAQVEWNQTTKEVKVSKDGKVVILTIGLNAASVDGQTVPIEAAPIVDNGTTLLPVRFISEQFNISTVYNPANKTVTLTGSGAGANVPNNTPPTAQFSFGQDTYIAGQLVTTTDESLDADGDAIIERQWQINGDASKTTSDLSKIFSKPKEGTYDIGLRVKDAKGTWSEWFIKAITIEPNQKPVVTELKAKKDSYARGEKLDFEYLYENESWEGIKSERWSYRPVSSTQTTMTPIKPEAIFQKGEYIIDLQLEDEYGNLGDKKEATVTINDTVVETEFQYKFTKGKIGDTIDNFDGFNYRGFKEIFPTEVSADKGMLIMSDSPEVVTEKGILYQQIASGQGRVVVHHISDFPLEDPSVNNKRLVIMVSNPGTSPATVTLSNKVMKGPIEDVLHLGQRLLYTYFLGVPAETLNLAPNSSSVIYDNGKSKWGKGQNISGMFDFNASAPVVFTVAALNPEDKIENINQMNKPAKDIHPRGTFDVLAKHYTVDLNSESTSIMFVIGNGPQEWLNGVDSITGETVQNSGNFGVEYHIQVTAKEDTALIINPRGNAYKGAIKWKDDTTYLTPSAGYFTGGRDRAAFGGVILAGQTREFVYMLPNGSAAPVLFGLIPKSEWTKY